MGKVFVTGDAGNLYQIDPTQPAGAVTTLSSVLGNLPVGIAYDGMRIWTANSGTPGSVSIVTLNPTTVTNVTTGFNSPAGVLYDGANVWVTDAGDNSIKKLDSAGVVLLSVPVGANPLFPAFDGTNIWVPNFNGNSVTVVRANTGVVIATFTGLHQPAAAAFDGERVLVTNNGDGSTSLWRASDLTPIGTFSTGAGSQPYGACSDGLNFWIAFNINTGKLARF
jgi:hypothetical protein